jgi:hypothetical protein
MIPDSIEKYIQTRAVSGRWQIEGTNRANFSGAVVIPALAEGQNLFATLQTLARNPVEFLSRFLILVVVNHREDAAQADKDDNRQTLFRLKGQGSLPETLQIGWVDAASPGKELPLKTGGVGLARKIGLDLALSRLNFAAGEPILISLDADTLVRPDYLPALCRHFLSAARPGAVISFCHQPGADPEEARAISRYELFLRSYVLGLSLAGSPYAFHTVGSAMACPARAYAGMGGMNLRAAAEDFYFLQHLAKTGGIDQVRGTVVYPSPRTSHRVPFGTGRSMSRMLAGERDAVMFYDPACFQILKAWLDLVSRNPAAAAEPIASQAEKISKDLASHLEKIGFTGVWEKLQKNFRDQKNLLSGFHSWFDGLKTMKLVHHLSAGPLPRCEPDKALPKLFELAGLEARNDAEEQLSKLREIQIGEDFHTGDFLEPS